MCMLECMYACARVYMRTCRHRYTYVCMYARTCMWDCFGTRTQSSGRALAQVRLPAQPPSHPPLDQPTYTEAHVPVNSWHLPGRRQSAWHSRDRGGAGKSVRDVVSLIVGLIAARLSQLPSIVFDCMTNLAVRLWRLSVFKSVNQPASMYGTGGVCSLNPTPVTRS